MTIAVVPSRGGVRPGGAGGSLRGVRVSTAGGGKANEGGAAMPERQTMLYVAIAVVVIVVLLVFVF